MNNNRPVTAEELHGYSRALEEIEESLYAARQTAAAAVRDNPSLKGPLQNVFLETENALEERRTWADRREWALRHTDEWFRGCLYAVEMFEESKNRVEADGGKLPLCLDDTMQSLADWAKEILADRSGKELAERMRR